ncbi:MAG: glycosyltransferase [Proteobacteria bacterium]|nr:glycosyltransferase [Pseudomonadota bacterium]
MNPEPAPLITLTTPALGGGIGRNLVNLSNEFFSLGYRVHIVSDSLEGPFFDLLREGIGVYRLRTSHPLGGLSQFSWYLYCHKPKIILTPVVRHTILALRGKHITGSEARIFAQVHNTYSQTFALLKESKRKKRIRLLKKYYPRCERIIAVSKGTAKDFISLTGIPKEKIVALHNPMTTDDITLLAEEDPGHPWFAGSSPPVILGVGRLTTAKNFSLLIRAFEMVRSQRPCRLLILGDGHLRGTLEEQAASSPFRDDISLAGSRINPFAFMRRAAVFVMSSSWEGFGNVLVEAMATGTPVVSTDCPHGPREILDNGKYGPLVPTEEPGLLAKAILDQLSNPTPPDVLREGAQRFNARTIAKNYLEVFGLLAGPPLPGDQARPRQEPNG